MLRQGPLKYVHFAEGHPPLLFDLSNDPRELNSLAADSARAGDLGHMRALLESILDPEAVNRQAFADQAAMIEALGGLDVINAMPSFNHTPLQSG